MKCDWIDVSRHVDVKLHVKDYPIQGVTFEDMVPIIHEIREKADSMIIKIDLHGASLISVERIKAIIKLCAEVTEYTRQDNILRQIQVLEAGFLFRMVYAPLSVAIPRYFRDIIVFK